MILDIFPLRPVTPIQDPPPLKSHTQHTQFQTSLTPATFRDTPDLGSEPNTQAEYRSRRARELLKDDEFLNGLNKKARLFFIVTKPLLINKQGVEAKFWNPAIKKLIHSVLFLKAGDLGIEKPGLFQDGIPKAGFLLCCCALKCALESFVTAGHYESIYFTRKGYGDDYKRWSKELDSVQDLDKLLNEIVFEGP
jgi:hypothetical protein